MIERVFERTWGGGGGERWVGGGREKQEGKGRGRAKEMCRSIERCSHSILSRYITQAGMLRNGCSLRRVEAAGYIDDRGEGGGGLG